MQRALRQFRVVAIIGARQVGKSTLVQTMAGRHFVTLDDLGALSAGEADPRAFIRSRARHRRLGRYRTAVARRPRSHLHRRTARPLLAQHPQAAGQVAEALLLRFWAGSNRDGHRGLAQRLRQRSGRAPFGDLDARTTRRPRRAVRTPTELHFYRTHSQEEVDFVLVRSGEIIGIEVKNGTTVRGSDAAALESMKEQFPKQFRFGMVLYRGATVIPLSAHAVAVPLGAFFGGR